MTKMTDTVEEYFGEKSVFQVFVTLIRYPTGISLFLLPWAMQFGGLIGGPVIVTFFIIINAYRSHVLAKVAQELTSLGVPSPAGCSDWWVFESSIGKVQRSSLNCYLVIFSALQWIALLGHASAFLAFAGTSFHQVHVATACPDIAGNRIGIAICTGIVIFLHPVTQWIRNQLQEPFARWHCPTIVSSFIFLLIPAFLAVFFGVPVIVTKMAEIAKGKTSLNPSIDVQWDKLTLLLAGVSFVIGATPDDVTGAFGNLRSRSLFSFVLSGMAATTFLIGVGFSAAVFLGIDGKTCESVTYNLPLDVRRYDAVRVLSSTAAVLFVAFRHQIEPRLSSRLSVAEMACDIIFKVLFLAAAGGIAIGIPRFAGLACLFGSLTSFIFTLVFPFLCDLLLHVTGGRVPDDTPDADEGTRLTREPSRGGQKSARSILRIIRDIIFIVLGLAGMVAGMIATVKYLSQVEDQSATCKCALPDRVPATP